MGKKILIATIIVGIAIMLLLSSQQVYAPGQSSRVNFTFSGSTSAITSMQGAGSWAGPGSQVGAGSQIGAGGTWTDASGNTGGWTAISLVTAACGVCSSPMTSPTTVSFTAKFTQQGAPPFIAEVVIGSGADNVGTGAVENFWTGVPILGFGTATITFF